MSPQNELRCGEPGWHRAVVLVRRETPEDAAVIHAVTAAAFARPGEGVPVEAPLVGWLRASSRWWPLPPITTLSGTLSARAEG
jgi:hypothetical protein